MPVESGTDARVVEPHSPEKANGPMGAQHSRSFIAVNSSGSAFHLSGQPFMFSKCPFHIRNATTTCHNYPEEKLNPDLLPQTGNGFRRRSVICKKRTDKVIAGT